MLYNLESWLLNSKAQEVPWWCCLQTLGYQPKHLGTLSFALPLSRHCNVCLVHVDDNIVASGCMAFARPSSAAVLGFLYIKFHTPVVEQVVHEDETAEHRRERTSTPKTTRHTSPQERTRIDKHLNKNSKTEDSRRVQIQFKFKTTSTKFQEHATNKHVMILSCRGVSYGIAIFLMTPWQLHHWIIFIP